MQSCVVYHLKCSNCNADYIGKTSRQVKRRFEEHKSGSQKDETYACFDNEKTFNHKIDYENFKILDRASSDQMVLIKEMLHIDKLKPSLNKQKQSYYTCLLLGRKIKKKT
jgi:predicted GIY-YIG superfamily endonuclease